MVLHTMPDFNDNTITLCTCQTLTVPFMSMSMGSMSRNFYLINNKEYEPDFPENVREAVATSGAVFHDLSIDTFSFFCPRNTAENTRVYARNGQIDLNPGDYHFIRTLRPNGPATAILTLVLREAGVPYSEPVVNLQHDILSSKLSQPFQLKGIAAFPDTWVFTQISYPLHKERILDTFSFPVVLKTKGSQGKRVWKCNSMEELDEQITEVNKEIDPKLLMLQEFTPNDFDIRVIVWKGEILSSIRRTSADGFLNNVSQGGTAELIDLTEEEVAVSLATAKKLDLELAGIDIVRTDHGPLLFEVNRSPDIACFNEAAGFSIEAEITKRILRGD